MTSPSFAFVLVTLAVCSVCSATLLSATVLTRHGARSPYLSIPGLKLETWECSFSVFQYPQSAPVSPQVQFDGQLYRKNYIPHVEALPGNCSQGELTNTGAAQLQATGLWLRKVLGSLLPPQWEHGFMYARSTNLDRTFASAENLLQTLFPGRSGPGNASVINIWTIEQGFDDLDVAVNAPCPALTNKCHEISTSAEWMNHTASLAPLRKTVADQLGVNEADLPDIFLVLEVLRARRAQGLPMHVDNDTYTMVEEAASWELRTLYNDPLVHQLTSGQILKQIVDEFANVINGSSTRMFTLLAAHDTTVAPMLSALQIPWTTWPQYAANLVWMLHEVNGDYFISVLHDREPVQMADCPFMCPWKQFLQIASQSIVTNRAAKCGSRKRAILVDPLVQYLC